MRFNGRHLGRTGRLRRGRRYGDGSFHIEPLAAGRYTPVVYDDKRALWNLAQASYEVHPDETTHIELPMAPVDALE